MFFCCGEEVDNNKEVYEVRVKNKSIQVYQNMDCTHAPKMNSTMQVIKIKKSDYNVLVKAYKNSKEKWEDSTFPPNSTSLGNIPQIQVKTWKRLSDIVVNPILFDGKIQPQDVIQGALGDCYFLSAAASLAERQERIKNIFGQQSLQKNGIYRVTMRINGIIEQIIIDDYVPVSKQGIPIFCQPNKNQIWIPLLEKAWAKVNGSYENIIAGSPTEIFKAATFAPSMMIQTKGEEHNEKLWKIIHSNAIKNRPCCCGTLDNQQIQWEELGLVPAHAYSLINAAELQSKDGKSVRVLKLRNPWGHTQWQGKGNQKDNNFWSSINPNQQKSQFLKDKVINNDGVFFILFSDYVKYFSQTHLCFMQENANYVYNNFSPVKKTGFYWAINIFEEDDYTFEIHQESDRIKHSDDQECRATIVIAKKQLNGSFQYIGGVMSNFQEDTSLKLRLLPGKYTAFTKYDESLVTKKIPLSSSISIYSLHFGVLELSSKAIEKNFLRQTFLSHARKNKKKKYENDTLWVSNKLMFKEGGYAYIAFGSEKQSKHKWVIQFNQSDFDKLGYKLKKPYKRKGDNQILQILPGNQSIILARIKNQNLTNLKFPPPITWKMVPIL